MIQLLFRIVCAIPQFLTGFLTPMPVVALLRRFTRPQPIPETAEEEAEPDDSVQRFLHSIILWVLAGVGTALFVAVLVGLSVGIKAAATLIPEVTLNEDGTPSGPPIRTILLSAAPFVVLLAYFGLTIWGYLAVSKAGTDTRPTLVPYGVGVRLRFQLWMLVFTICLLALSLLPLSSLLLGFPAVFPQESVLNESVRRRNNWFLGFFGRVASLVLGLTVLLGLLALSVEIVSRLTLPPQGSFAVIPKTLLMPPESILFPGKTPEEKKAIYTNMAPEAKDFLTTPLHERMPTALIEHWPFVFLVMYLLDIVVLMFVGNVPIKYNLRNVSVRWKTNAMTALAFTAVVGLLTFLLAFVNSMNEMTQNTGVPGNVFILSDGSTDEVFSNLKNEEVDNLERVQADELQAVSSSGRPLLDDDGKELWKPMAPLGIRKSTKNGRESYLASRETYYSISMIVPKVVPEKRRFVQMRTLEDGPISGEVHKVEFYPGGRWFSDVGVDNSSRIECVLGDGIAKTMGQDVGKKSMEIGDTFILGDMEWIVTGILKSEGTTFSSEIWAKRFSRIYEPLGKKVYTTVVLRGEKDSIEASRAIANYFNKRYSQQKVKAYAEPDYYAELTKTNNVFLTVVIVVCIVMAIGGVFGMMTTMFASIAQRIRDIGVLRLLGFKRWQLMVSFMLESLTIALIGGIIGVAMAWLLANGRSTVSTLSAGGGGPGGKSVVLMLIVSAEVMAMGLLFALAMGRLGGLVPALSAMQKKILDSLR
jgi:putative ABC transport system permease protein